MDQWKFDLAMPKNGFQCLFSCLLRVETDLLRQDVVAVFAQTSQVQITLGVRQPLFRRSRL
jgi:hypothetical protein